MEEEIHCSAVGKDKRQSSAVLHSLNLFDVIFVPGLKYSVLAAAAWTCLTKFHCWVMFSAVETNRYGVYHLVLQFRIFQIFGFHTCPFPAVSQKFRQYTADFTYFKSDASDGLEIIFPSNVLNRAYNIKYGSKLMHNSFLGRWSDSVLYAFYGKLRCALHTVGKYCLLGVIAVYVVGKFRVYAHKVYSIKFASCCADAAAYALVLIDPGRTAAQAA